MIFIPEYHNIIPKYRTKGHEQVYIIWLIIKFFENSKFIFRSSENMWWTAQSLPTFKGQKIFEVNHPKNRPSQKLGKLFEWRGNFSNLYKYQSVTYINQICIVSCFQIMQHRSLVQVGQITHIFAFLKLRRINLLNLIFLQNPFVFSSDL